MNHEDFKGLVPVFALDALPAEEEEELVAHLKVCRECSDALLGYKETAGMVALAPPSVEAPPGLRERILSEASKTPQLQSRDVPVERGAAPGSRFPWWQRAGLVAATVVALIAGGAGYLRLEDQSQRLNEQQAVIEQQREAMALVSSPDAVVHSLTATEAAPGSGGRAFVSPDRGSAAVVLSGLETPQEGVYTLWAIAGGNPRAVTDFLPSNGVALLPVEGPLEPDATLAVTHEPQRGNTAPQGPVILAAGSATSPDEG